jgi:hypothetical protein
MKPFRVFLWVSLLLLVAGLRPAHAYLDPGSGSMILQLVLGGVAGLLVVLKLLWQRLLVMFGVRKDPPPDIGGSEANTPRDTP